MSTPPYVVVPRRDAHVFAEVAEWHFDKFCLRKEPHILDVGAHVGAFALRCLRQWPNCHVTSFEPHPENARLLRHNLQGTGVDIHDAAVWNVKSAPYAIEAPLYLAESSLGHSLYRLAWQTAAHISVPLYPARELPICDLLKIDTEGSELQILEGYGERIKATHVVLLEWHVRDHRKQIADLLHNAGLVLLRETLWSRTGHMTWMRAKP